MAATSGGVGPGSVSHPDSEQLALLAMEADVDAGVKEHVAQCAACDRDLSVIRSLLDAEGPDGPDGAAQRSPAPPDRAAAPPPAAAMTAMADAHDGEPEIILQNLPPKEARKQAERLLSAQRSPRQGRQTLMVILLVVVAMLLVGLLALR